jgi:hypothetical protein
MYAIMVSVVGGANRLLYPSKAMPQPFDVPLSCPKCRRTMSVRIQLPRQFQPRQQPAKRTIYCPHQDCDGHIDPEIHGEVIAVWPGHIPLPISQAIH